MNRLSGSPWVLLFFAVTLIEDGSSEGVSEGE